LHLAFMKLIEANGVDQLYCSFGHNRPELKAKFEP